MSLLSDLRDFLTEHRRSPRKIVADAYFTAADQEPDRLLLSFYRLLWRGSEVDEASLATELYGPEADTNTNAYKKLKQRAVEQLSGQLILVGSGSPAFTAQQRGFYRAHREYVIAELLRARNFKASAAYFHRKALLKASKYGLSSLEVLCLDALSYHAGVQGGNAALFAEYNRRYEEAFLRMRAEREVTRCYVELSLESGTSPAGRLRKHALAVESVERLDEQYNVHDLHPRYAFSYFTVKLVGWMTVSDHAMTMSVADESIRYFSRQSPLLPVPLSYFYMHKLLVYALRKDYENGIKVYQKCLTLVERGLTNFYRLSQLTFFLLLQTGHYNEAAELYLRFTEDPIFQKVPPRVREQWLVYQAYLYYLYETGNITGGQWRNSTSNFRVNKFLNSVPIFSKEKRGRNIPVLVLQILFTILRRDFVTAEARIEAIEKYTSRHLRRDENYRSNCFIRLLLLFPKCQFRYRDVDRRSKPWLRKLAENPVELANQSYELELIPYDRLFGIALAGLG